MLARTPRGILKITAMAMNNPAVALNLAAIEKLVIRAMYRCRNRVPNPEVVKTIKAIAMRFDMAGLRYGRQVLYVGLKFAAMGKSLPVMA